MTKKRYEHEFKLLIVELLQSGRTASQVSDEYGLNPNMIRRWKREFESRGADVTKKSEPSAQQVELRALRKELREVTMERDILKMAVSIFSKSGK